MIGNSAPTDVAGRKLAPIPAELTTCSGSCEPASTSPIRRWWSRCGGPEDAFESAVYSCLLLLAAALIHSKAVTQVAYSAALVLWLAKLVIRRQRPLDQPLVLPSLAFLVLSAISSALSPVPALSWAPMKSVALLIVFVLYAQNLRTRRQIKTVILVLLASTLLSAGYTAWQYGYGIGAKLVNVAPAGRLDRAGLMPGDIIVAVNGHRVHNPRGATHELARTGASPKLKLLLERGEALVTFEVEVDRQALVEAGPLGVGRPPRALGGLNHAVIYALVLLQIALLVWGLLLSATLARQRMKWFLFAAFVPICATLGATVTRACVVSLLAIAVMVFWMAIPSQWARGFSMVAVVMTILVISVWVRRERGLGMVALNDGGTQFRVLMWEDGWRLLRQHPLFGVGMDSTKALWRQWDLRAYEEFTQMRANFHSSPIGVAVERGLLTLAAWLWLMFLYVRLLLQWLREVGPDDWFSRGIFWGIFGAAIGFLATSLVQDNLRWSEVQTTFWLMMGVAIALHRTRNCRPGRKL